MGKNMKKKQTPVQKKEETKSTSEEVKKDIQKNKKFKQGKVTSEKLKFPIKFSNQVKIQVP